MQSGNHYQKYQQSWKMMMTRKEIRSTLNTESTLDIVLNGVVDGIFQAS